MRFALPKRPLRAWCVTQALEAIVGGLPIRGPDFVSARLTDEDGAAVLAASHDGYSKRYGLMHNRKLILSADGKTLAGVDKLTLAGGRRKTKGAMPYAVHFHLHPDCKCERGPAPEQCRIRMRDGEVWLFKADGVRVSIEDSLHFVDSAGPRPSCADRVARRDDGRGGSPLGDRRATGGLAAVIQGLAPSSPDGRLCRPAPA